MFVATLGGIFKFKDLPEEYGPYVQFKATIENREVQDDDEIAILDITGTDSHHVLFLDSYQNIDQITEELKEAIKNEIREKNSNLVGNMASQGTTPRRITDLIGSLCDLTSGSGDKGTPVVFVQGYFDNLSND